MLVEQSAPLIVIVDRRRTEFAHACAMRAQPSVSGHPTSGEEYVLQIPAIYREIQGGARSPKRARTNDRATVSCFKFMRSTAGTADRLSVTSTGARKHTCR